MNVMEFRYRKKMKSRPRPVRAGEAFCVFPRAMVENRSEEALIMQFVCDRKLFGRAYRELQPSYFDQMPYGGGVFVGPLVRTSEIVTGAIRPGDIDLLIIPYEGDLLILDRVLVVEVKAVRARFVQQGKSPNEFGFSQALSLLELGFPYVAVTHLIISDASPREFWRTMMTAQVLEGDEVKILGPELVDPLPYTLIDRVYGRLLKMSTSPNIGLISAYVWSKVLGSASHEGRTIIFPDGRPANLNPSVNTSTLESVAAYYEKNSRWFLDNPMYDPK